MKLPTCLPGDLSLLRTHLYRESWCLTLSIAIVVAVHRHTATTPATFPARAGPRLIALCALFSLRCWTFTPQSCNISQTEGGREQRTCLLRNDIALIAASPTFSRRQSSYVNQLVSISTHCHSSQCWSESLLKFMESLEYNRCLLPTGLFGIGNIANISP